MAHVQLPMRAQPLRQPRPDDVDCEL